MRTTTFHLPPSPFPLRAGLTLAEVLISMGILVVGLLGVASLFPVGGHYMQQGDIADRAGAIAQAALDDAIVRGHLNPENWIGIDFDAVAGRKNIPGDSGTNACEFYPLVLSLCEIETEFTTASPLFAGMKRGPARDAFYGGAYVIDPLGVAATLQGNGTTNVWQSFGNTGGVSSKAVRRFPATSKVALGNTSQWLPWFVNDNTWPVRRLTTTIDHTDFYPVNTITQNLQSPAAEKLFATSDDLALIFPDNGDNPTRGRWQTWNNDSTSPQAASRQSRGDYSWIISVSPGSSEARDALAKRPDAFQYDVSAVVFYKRDLGEGYEGALAAERLVTAKVVSTGTAGGELLLERRPTANDSITTSPFEDLRSGEYIMLTGPHPLSTANQPMLFLQWYRVLTIEDSGQPRLDGTTNTHQLSGDGNNARVLVSLRGPDWPWQPTGNLSDSALSNDLRMTIIPGAVAVHSKTMRLESGSAWGNE